MVLVQNRDEASARQRPSDVDRFQVIYDDNYDDLWKYCLRRSSNPNEAEDVLSEVFAVAWRRLNDVPPGPDARPWLFGVARNQLKSSWRSRLRVARTVDRLVSNRTTTTTNLNAPSDASEVAQALSLLSDADQEVLRLVAWERLSHADAGVVLGCSENAVAIRLHRARDRFQKNLDNLKGRSANEHVTGEGGHRR